MQRSVTIDDILTYMTLSIQKKNPWGKMHQVPLTYFSPAFVLYVEEDDIYDKLRSSDYYDSYGIFEDATLNDLEDPNLDISIFITATPDEKAINNKYQVGRSRLMTAKEKRPYFFAGFPAIEQTTAFIGEDGSFTTGKAFYIKTGTQWRAAVNCDYPKSPYGQDVSDYMTVAIGAAFSQYFEWTVTLGYPGYPHVTFNCTPKGAKDIFRLRDVPEGKQRRSAIHHWVGEHRRRKTESDEYINILDYLRGQMQFTWNGLNCTIKPSPSDLKKYYKLHPQKQALLYR